MSGVVKVFQYTVKSHLEFYRDLKYTLSLEELHTEGYEIYQVPGAYYFLNNFTNLYKYNPKNRDYLSVFLLHGVVKNMSGNINSTFPLKSYNVLSVSAAHPIKPLIFPLEICWVRLCTVFKRENLNLVKTCPSLTAFVKK